MNNFGQCAKKIAKDVRDSFALIYRKVLFALDLYTFILIIMLQFKAL